MAFTIYMLECPAGRRYVGCTAKDPADRLKGHESSARPWPGDGRALLCDAINRYGRAAFKLSILALVERIEDAAAVETLMIARHGTAQPNGYNAMKTSHYTARRLKVVA